MEVQQWQKGAQQAHNWIYIFTFSTQPKSATQPSLTVPILYRLGLSPQQSSSTFLQTPYTVGLSLNEGITDDSSKHRHQSFLTTLLKLCWSRRKWENSQEIMKKLLNCRWLIYISVASRVQQHICCTKAELLAVAGKAPTNVCLGVFWNNFTLDAT